MSGTSSILISGNLAVLAVLVVFLFTQFRIRLEYERFMFDKNQRREYHEKE